MKLAVIFLFLFSFSSYGVDPLHYQNYQKSQKQQSGSISELEIHKVNLEKGIDALLSTLLYMETSEEKKTEIINVLMQSLVLSDEITSTLKELVLRGTVCAKDEENQEICAIESDSGLVAQAGLIKLHTEALLKAKQDEWDMIMDGVLIVAGAGILFIPVAGPIIAVAGVKLGGAAVLGIGAYRVGRNLEIIGTQKSVFDLIKTVALRNTLAQAVFHLAQSGNVELANKVIFSSTQGEVISTLYDVINSSSDDYTAETKRIAVETLLVFFDEVQRRRTDFIELLTGVIDEKKNDEESLKLKLSAVKALGQIGKGVWEVERYLEAIGKDESEKEDEMRLFALFELGRNATSFSTSVELLGEWLNNRRKKAEEGIEPVQISEIPEYYLQTLLESKDISEDHITVLREFVRSEILNFEDTLKSSAVLSDWDNSEETKLVLQGIYEGLFVDINRYLNELEREGLFEGGQEGLDFLQTQISKFEGIKDFERALFIVSSIISKFKEDYKGQEEIIEKLENFLILYKKIVDVIKN